MAGSQEIQPSEEPIWTLPHMHKADFYAAAYCMAAFRSQQKSSLSRKPRPPDTAFKARFLDFVALLFARYRKSRTSKNVTATVLVSKDAEAGRPVFKVYVAKNGGPEGGHNGPDDDLGKRLASWLTDDVFSQDPEDDASKEALEYLKVWWRDRTLYYLQNITELWPKIWDENNHSANAAILTVIERAGLQKEFKEDLPEAAKIVKIVQEADRQKSIEDLKALLNSRDKRLKQRRIEETVREIEETRLSYCNSHNIQRECWSFSCRPSTAKYSEISKIESEEPEGIRMANNLRKLVKYIELLGAPYTACRTFAQFCKANENPIVKFDFLWEPGVFVLERRPVLPVLQKWESIPNSISGSFSKSNRRFKTVLDTFNSESDLPRYFHCELQMLERFNSGDESSSCYDYIGCSKRSCFFCWWVLNSHPRFQTGASHFQISPNSAFPFDITKTECVIDALKGLQNYLLEFVTARVFNWNSEQLANTHIDQTTLPRSISHNVREARAALLQDETPLLQDERIVTAIKISATEDEWSFCNIKLVPKEVKDANHLQRNSGEVYSKEKYRSPEFRFPEFQFHPPAEQIFNDPQQSWTFHCIDSLYLRVYARLDSALDANLWCLNSLKQSKGHLFKQEAHYDPIQFIWRGDIFLLKATFEDNSWNGDDEESDYSPYPTFEDISEWDKALIAFKKLLEETWTSETYIAQRNRLYSDVSLAKAREDLRRYEV